MKLDKILFIIGTTLVIAGCCLFIAGAFLNYLEVNTISNTFLTVSSILGFASLAILIVRLVLMSRRATPNFGSEPKVVVKVVDVKDLPKSPEEKLYEQYEDLYKRNLITKEELEQKRIELLGK